MISKNSLARNWLPAFTAIASVLLGGFLILGGVGHLSAILPVSSTLEENTAALEFRQALPGVILVGSGLTNLVLSRWLFNAGRAALRLAMLVNTALLAYLVYLLIVGVPNHPLALFATLVGIFLVIAGVTRSGIRWPATPTTQL